MTKQVAIRSGTLLAPELDYVILDGSGSMSGKWLETLAALRAFISDLRGANINSHIIASVFSTPEGTVIQRDCKLCDCAPFENGSIETSFGGSPLFDSINHMARHLRELDPPRCSIVIVTDGMANGDRFTDVVQAKSLLDWCRAKGWQVTFLGCDFNNMNQALALGANECNAIGVSRKLLTDAAHTLAKKREHYSRTGSDINFTKDEQQQFGGLLPKPTGGA